MARMRFNRVQPIIALSLLALAGGCEADPIEPSAEVVALAAKPEKPPEPSQDTGELVLRRYYVEAVPEAAQGLGLTKNLEVNKAVYAYFESLGQGPTPEGGWAEHLGCPDGSTGCSAVTLEFTGGKVEGLQLSVVPVVGSCGNGSGTPCLLDAYLVNRRKATLRWGAVAPTIPWELLQPAIELGAGADGASLLTLYWQGQRGMERMTDTGETEKIRGKMQPIYEWEWHWDRFPDLNFPDPAEGPDKFFFHPVFKIRDGLYYHPTYSDSTLLAWCDLVPGCLAEYQGELGKSGLRVEFEKVTEETGLVELAVRAFNDEAENSNPLSFGRVMLTHPEGGREMLDYDWQYHTSTRRDESGDAATWYRLENLDLGSCYTFDLVGLIVLESEMRSFAEDNRLVWGGESQQLQVGSCSVNSSG